jgi:hypothetical protein
MQLQAETVAFAERISLNDLESLHGIEQTMSGRLVDAESGSDLGDAHFWAVLAKVNENAQRFLQRLA